MTNGPLKPGSIALCRPDLQEGLTIWKSYRSKIDDNVDTVNSEDIMIVLKFKPTPKKNISKFTDEWQIGAYKVLTPRGIIGWVGEGWVVSV